MSTITLDKLYANYDVLNDAGDKVGEHAKEYEEIISGVKGGEKEKKLASQFIAKFFKNFPSLQLRAVDAIFDICEDEDSTVRKQGIKVLPNLCKVNKEHILKVADILAQLLQVDDPQEQLVAANSLTEVIKLDPAQAVKAIFKQIEDGDDVVREKCIKFVVTKLKSLGSEIITKDVEELIVSECKKILVTCTAEEFELILQYLGGTRLGKTPLGHQELVNLGIEQAELDQPFDAMDKDSDSLNRLRLAVNIVLPYFSNQVQSTKFVSYICNQILPQWEILGGGEITKADALRVVVLKYLAELSTYCGPLENPVGTVEHVFDILKMYMPPPPEDSEVKTFPYQEYTFVECLIYVFHRLARQCPEFLTENPKVLKDFRARLQYFARGVQGARKALEQHKDPKLTENAYKVTTNINTLIKDLFYSPPSYKSNIKLSWKNEEKTKEKEEKVTNAKRHVPITFDKGSTPAKSNRRSTEIYTPPSGKFSQNIQGTPLRKPRGRGGMGRSRGGWRK